MTYRNEHPVYVIYILYKHISTSKLIYFKVKFYEQMSNKGAFVYPPILYIH